MNSYELGRTFFPSTRKELLVESLSLLETRAGEKRIKIGLCMPLSDGKLVGLPGWIGDALDIIGKEDSLESSVKFSVDLHEMTHTIYPNEDSQKPAQLAVVPLMNAFQLRRDPQDEDGEEVSDVNLHFVAYVTASMDLWRYFYGVHRKSIFVKFETTQQELPLTTAQPEAQMTLQ